MPPLDVGATLKRANQRASHASTRRPVPAALPGRLGKDPEFFWLQLFFACHPKITQPPPRPTNNYPLGETLTLLYFQPQCDEGHPTCNNCKKSKRECLGYDPIFKQQQGPAAIQPAPSSQPSTPSAVPSTTPTVPSSSTNHSYQATYPPPPAPIVAFESPVSTTPQSVKTDTPYDYSAAIDPALQAADASSATGTSGSHYQQQVKAEPGSNQHSGDNNSHLRGGTPYSSFSNLSQREGRVISRP